MKLKFSGNAYLIDSNNDENFKEIEEPSMTALGDLDWNDPYLKNTNSDKYYIFFDALVLLISVSSETSILS